MCFNILNAQTFSNVAFDIGIYHQYNGTHYGGGVSFYDWNKDGLDDLTLTNDGINPAFYLNVGGTFQQQSSFIETVGEVKCLLWVDYDNDGDPDISVSSYLEPFLLFNNDGNFNFTEVSAIAQIPDYNHKSFGHNWGDFDNDGDLDLYIANYNFNDGIANYFFRNNGDGTFYDITAQTDTGNGARTSFQGVFIDYNNNGVQDLFLINDRNIAQNYMFHNNGNGTFSDLTVPLGFNYFIDAMSNSWADYDNDGDFDVYITNSQNNLLHRNDGNFFPDVAFDANVPSDDFSWCATWIDFNNDGWKDLFVCNSPFITELGQSRLFLNNTDGTFNDVTGLGFQGTYAWSRNSAKGDFDNDGDYDLIVSNTDPSVSSFWENSGNQNNFIKVTLEGTLSNKDAIGSKIETYSNNLYQLETTFCGDAFMAQNSQHLIIGLGQNQLVDSLVITWPRGFVETYYNLDVNQSYQFVEGASIPPVDLGESLQFICQGENVELYAGDYNSYLWSNGLTTPSIIVDEPGFYSVQVVNENGFIISSEQVEILFASAPEVSYTAIQPSCENAANGEIVLQIEETPFLYTVSWDNDFVGNTLQNLNAGIYNYTIQYLNECSISGSVELENGEGISAETTVLQTPCFQTAEGIIAFTNPFETGIAQLLVNGEVADNPLTGLAGGIYQYEITDDFGCTASGEIALQEYPELITLLSFENVSCFEANDGLIDIWNQSETGFGQCEINGISITLPATNLDAGLYEIVYTDANGCEIEHNAEITEPAILELELTSFDATDQNLGYAILDISGGTEPYTIFWTSGDSDLDAENLEPGVYQVTVTDNNGCSETAQFEIDFIEYTKEVSSKFKNITLYPNPGDGIVWLNLDLFGIEAFDYKVINAFGEIVLFGKINTHSTQKYIDISHLSDGIYFIHLKDFYTVIKYIKQD